MDLERDGNLIEAGVWFLLAIILFIHAIRSARRLWPTLFILVVTLAIFGASDLVESRTGAWWKPWWLFVWKAVCVVVLFIGFVRYFRLTKKRTVAGSDSQLGDRVKMILVATLLVITSGAHAQFAPKPVPRVQALPLPHHEISFQRDGVELTRFHFDPQDKRPFLYPLNGPSGRSLTRMGHPHDPITHSHHNSLWLAHHDVNGVSFWEDRGPAQIRCERVEQFEDGDESAFATVLNSWGATNKVFLWERRRMTVQSLASNEWMLVLDVRFDAEKEAVTLGKTPFGLVAVRMAKSIGVNDGGGIIRNSEGGVNEAGVFWKRARWVDYSGAITSNAVEGITFFDHPGNPSHPSYFHVRNDGWMGASLTFDEPRVIETNRPLQLRYGFYVHSRLPATNVLEKRWTGFSKTALPDLARPKK